MSFNLKEAVALTRRLLPVLRSVPLDSASPRAADFRRALGIVDADAEVMIRNAAISGPLSQAFGFAFDLGGTVDRFDRVRKAAEDEAPVSVEAEIMALLFIRLALVYEARAIIANVTFKSRQDVDAMKARMSAAFAPAQEYAADNKEPEVFRALVALHSAVIRDLVTRGRPLPRMTNYRFGRSLPSLRLAQRLYGDASRAEEMRDENKIPSPLFMPIVGQALSA